MNCISSIAKWSMQVPAALLIAVGLLFSNLAFTQPTNYMHATLTPMPADAFDLDFTATLAPANAAKKLTTREDLAEAVIGESELSANGYYVRLAKESERAPKRKPQHKPPRVLIVEDDDATATVLKSILEVTGFHVFRAHNKASVVEGLRHEPDLVILDVVMPELNGLELLTRIRKHPKLADLPVLMLTSLSSVDDILNGMLEGANGYLTKPCKSRVLLHAMKQVLT
jgi:two-component system, OmpR family, response regulator